MTGHANVDGLDAYDSGNDDDLQMMSNEIANQNVTQKQQASSSSLVNRSLSFDVNEEVCKRRNFSFGIDWNQPMQNFQNTGSTYIFNNCDNINVNVDSKATKRKRIRIIYSSGESQED